VADIPLVAWQLVFDLLKRAKVLLKCAKDHHGKARQGRKPPQGAEGPSLLPPGRASGHASTAQLARGA